MFLIGVNHVMFEHTEKIIYHDVVCVVGYCTALRVVRCYLGSRFVYSMGFNDLRSIG